MKEMIAYSRDYKAEIEKLVGFVASGQLTADEAGQCLAGWNLKNHPALQREMFDHELQAEYEHCQLEIDSRLPGFSGLVLGRHI